MCIRDRCILDTCRNLEDIGFNVDYVGVNNEGICDLDEIESLMTRQTLCVTAMFVNNEIGVIQPIKELGALCHRKRVFFHTDAA